MQRTGSLSHIGRVACVINPLSGSVPADAAQLIAEKLSSLPDQPAIHITGHGDVQDVIRRALADMPDILIVWGGDGTIACALSNAGLKGPAILPLPGGTMNMLPKRLLGDAESWEDILDRAMLGGTFRTMPCGEVADGPKFFVAAMIGDMTRFAHSREALREGHFMEAAEIVHDASALALKSNIEWHVPGRKPDTATALTININPDTPGALEIATIDPSSLLDLARISMEMLSEGWREAESIDLTGAKEVEVRLTETRAISLTLDGELQDMPSPLRFRRIDRAANVFVPDLPE